MYSITHRDIEGLDYLQAAIQRKSDGLWWNNPYGWEETYAPQLLTEGTPGVYTGSASFDPKPGAYYIINVMETSSPFYYRTVTEDLYNPPQYTAIQLVNEVQKGLRLPQSSLITEPHAQLLLSFINRTLDILNGTVWDALKIRGAFYTEAGIDTYTIFPDNARSVEVIDHFQIGDSLPLVHRNDAYFREYIRTNTTQAQPLIYRNYGRAGGSLIIQVAPTPDKRYKVDFEGLQENKRLVNSTDVSLLDENLIIKGATMLAREEQGEDMTAELSEFQATYSMKAGTHGDSNETGVEPE